MKISYNYILIGALAVAISSCKKDNYDPPASILSGTLLYQGDTIYVERNSVHFQIYQYGLGKVGPVSTDETFAQNGTYSAVLFNGDYKVIVPGGDGPFVWKQTASGSPDSVSVSLNGSATVDLEVTPFYLVRTPQITFSAGDVSATFKVEKIITDPAMQKNIERVSLYINKTQFVSGGDNVAVTDMAGSAITGPNNITLSVKVPTFVPTQNYVFARIGVKIDGVEDMIFSPLQKIQF